MLKSDSIKEIATALAKAQAKLKNPPFDSKNPHFKSNYASLASVRDTIVPVFAEFGLSIIQNVSSRENGVTCSNLVMHSSGEWLETDPLEVPADKHNAHGYGSACTYARRFSLMALGCVVGDVDDDGNDAVKNAPTLLHKPAAGAYDGLSEPQKTEVCFVRDNILKVTDHGEDLSLEAIGSAYSLASVLDNDQKVALTDMLGKYSKLRKALKDYKATLTKEKEAA